MVDKMSAKQVANQVSSKANNSVSNNAVLSGSTSRNLPIFSLVWLDANIDESNTDFKTSLYELSSVVRYITTFRDAEKYIDFVKKIKNEQVFMVVSGSLGKKTVPRIETLP